MSRDAFSYDPQDAGDVRDDAPASPSPSAQTGSFRYARRQESGAGSPWPRRKHRSSRAAFRPATNAAILRAPTTSGIAPISSAIPRCTP